MVGRALLRLTLPAAVLLLGLNVAPLFFAGWESVHNGDMIAGGQFVGIQNYVGVLKMKDFWATSLFTLLYTVVVVFGSWIIGTALALLLRTRVPLGGLWRALLMLPWIIPLATAAGSWLSMAALPHSPLSGLEHAFGLGNGAFLNDPGWARAMLFTFRLWVSIPFMMLMMSSALASVDRNVYEAARVDGANAWQTLTRITLPLISRTTYISWILMAIFCVNDYTTIRNLTGGGPMESSRTLILLIWETADEQGFVFGAGLGKATAMAFMVSIVLVALAVLIYRLNRAGGEGTVDSASIGDAAWAGLRTGRRFGPGAWWRLLALAVITAVLLSPVSQIMSVDSLSGGPQSGLLAALKTTFTPLTVGGFWRSGLLASVTVVVCIVIGAPAGYAIARGRGRAISAFTVLVFSVLAFPVQLLLWPYELFLFRLHLVAPGISPAPMLLLVYIGTNLGFAVWMFSTFLKTMPVDIEEAAWSDGCSVIGAFFRVVLPNAMPAVISTGLFVFLLTWSEWQVSSTLYDPVISPNAVRTLGAVAAPSLLFLLPPLALFFIFSRRFSLGGLATGTRR